MSYSFVTTSPSKAGAKENVAAELDKVVELQPDHAKDRDVAYNTACAIIDQLKDTDEAFDVRVEMHGSIGWNWSAEAQHDPSKIELTHASVGVTAYYSPRK